ncbi:sodium/proton-translocating pyrophosphatase, partial [Rhizobium ruizarguesonis]
AADLFETYAVSVVATMVLAAIFFSGAPILQSAMVYPLAICGACIITSIIGTFFFKLGSNGSIMPQKKRCAPDISAPPTEPIDPQPMVSEVE